MVCPYPERYNDVNKDPISSGMGQQYPTVKALFATLFETWKREPTIELEAAELIKESNSVHLRLSRWWEERVAT